MAQLTDRICDASMRLRSLLSGEGELVERVDLLDDEELEQLAHTTADLARLNETVQSAVAGVIAKRSSIERGHGGFAQVRGSRNARDFVQSVTGASKEQANRQLRVGESMLDAAPPAPPLDGPTVDPQPQAWHAPLDRLLQDGRLSPAQLDAILRGLGRPTEGAEEAWQAAGLELADRCDDFGVEDLGRRARVVRDLLDVEGANTRAAHRYEQRSWRMYTTADGVQGAHVRFDDESGAWVRTISDAALRPRRGGVRFVTEEEKAAAAELAADPRTNDQLMFDLMMDVLRAGALADAEAVFGKRKPGVRVVVTDATVQARDAFGRPLGIGHVEDGGETLAGAVVATRICESGQQPIVLDAHGDPLHLGREQRSFSAKQNIALAVRDGGCLMPRCDRPPSYCEAHHIDEWWRHGGRTDIDRGILLCTFHHLHVHATGGRIRRDAAGFYLETPGAPGVVRLRSKAPWKPDPSWVRIVELARVRPTLLRPDAAHPPGKPPSSLPSARSDSEPALAVSVSAGP